MNFDTVGVTSSPYASTSQITRLKLETQLNTFIHSFFLSFFYSFIHSFIHSFFLPSFNSLNWFIIQTPSHSRYTLDWNANSKHLSREAKNGLEFFHHLRSVPGTTPESVIRHGRIPFYNLASLPPRQQGSKGNDTPHVPETKAANANDITIYYPSKSSVYSDYWNIWDKTWLHGERY